jgi:drug/metabolite transporter (DMT)-like permease
LALATAALWGATDFVGGVSSRAAGVLVALFLLQAWGMVLTTALALVAREPTPATDALTWAVIAGAVGVTGLACLFLALSRSAMGLVSPLAALMGAVIPAVIGIASGEQVSLILGVGITVALLAIVLISLPEGIGGRPVVPAFHGSRPVEWILIVGAGFGSAGFYLATARAHDAGLGTATTLLAVRVTSFVLVGVALFVAWIRSRAAGSAGPGGAAISVRRGVRIPRVAIVLGLLASMGDTLGTITYLGAVSVGTLSVTVVLVSLFPVTTALLARIFLHERLSRIRLIGVGLALAGASLIALGAVTG